MTSCPGPNRKLAFHADLELQTAFAYVAFPSNCERGSSFPMRHALSSETVRQRIDVGAP